MSLDSIIQAIDTMPDPVSEQADKQIDIRRSIQADLDAGPQAIDAAEPPDFIVEKIIPVCGANLASPGGGSKTTLMLNEAVNILIGGQLYRRDVIKQGVCVAITAEDGADYMRYLAQRILADGYSAGALSERAVNLAKSGLRFVTWSRAKFGPIAHVDRDGNISRAPAFDLLLEMLAPLDPAIITLDPLSLLGPGERFGNDADSFVAAMLHESARALGACVQVIDHVSQHVARTGLVDQHAARGGSAKADNARMVRQLVRVKPGDAMDSLPHQVTPDDLQQGRILQLHTTKLSYAPIPPMQWLRRKGHWIEALRSTSPEEAQAGRERQKQHQRDADIKCLVKALKAACERGQYPTARTVEDIGVISDDGNNIPRNRLRAAISVATMNGQIRQAPLPPELKKGARKDYLQPV